MNRRPTLLLTILCFGFAFLYVPILSMIVFSFNSSRLATVWGGFSTKWYGKLAENDAILSAATLSLEIALISATLSTVLGTMAGIALARFRRFRGRTLFSGMITSPLIMPDVITGISLLIFFILLKEYTGWPAQRGFGTVTLAHVSISLTYVTTVIQSRLSQADLSVEEAAMDLGSRPWQVMKDITLPIIAPAILSGWLLAFTISLDDVVVTSFATGPGTTTLPILVWSKVKLGVTPDINALASIIVAVVAVCVAIAAVMVNRAEKRRDRDARLAYQANE
ncbi:MAG: ABC transporter permease subunit [Paracoccaceae bacterium]